MINGATLSLQIRQGFGRLGLQIERPQQEIRQPAPELQIRQPAAQMTISGGPGKLTVDGSDAHAALGHKTNEQFIAAVASQAKQGVLDYIGNVASSGDQLAAIEKGTTVEDIIEGEMDRSSGPIDLSGPFSYQGVKVDYQPTPAQIDWQLGKVEISSIQHAPQISYTPGKVSAYVAQQNWIQVDVAGSYLNMQF